VHEENIALFRGIRSRSPLFQALTRNCRVCGQRNCVSMDFMLARRCASTGRHRFAGMELAGGLSSPPHELYLEKCLREKADPFASVKFGAEVRYYEDTLREELARTNDGAEGCKGRWDPRGQAQARPKPQRIGACRVRCGPFAALRQNARHGARELAISGPKNRPLSA
jgi:hypothetical protein